MRKVLYLLPILLLLGLQQTKAQNLEDLEIFEKAMKPGVELTYDVNADSKEYKLIVTLKKIYNGVSLTWKTTDPDNKSGSVDMSAAAVANAQAFSNVFTGGALKLDNETFLWLSKKMFNDLTSNAQAQIKLKGTADTATTLSNGASDYTFTVNGTPVAAPGNELEGGNPKRVIGSMASAKFPLIVKLDMGFTITLTEVKNP